MRKRWSVRHGSFTDLIISFFPFTDDMYTFSAAAGRYLCNVCIVNDWLNKRLVFGSQMSQDVRFSRRVVPFILYSSFPSTPSSAQQCLTLPRTILPQEAFQDHWESEIFQLTSTCALCPSPSVTRITPLTLVQCFLSFILDWKSHKDRDPLYPALGLPMQLSVEVEVAQLYCTHPFLTLNFR